MTRPKYTAKPRRFRPCTKCGKPTQSVIQVCIKCNPLGGKSRDSVAYLKRLAAYPKGQGK